MNNLFSFLFKRKPVAPDPVLVPPPPPVVEPTTITGPVVQPVNGMLDVVVDVSHWQGSTINWAVVRESGIMGVIIKASQGTSSVDPAFMHNAEGALDAGLLVGFYHFLTNEDGATQAKHYLDTLALVPADETADLIAFDWEQNGTNTATLATVLAFEEAVERTIGRPPVLYGNPDGFLSPTDRASGAYKWLARCPLWLPKYGPVPTSFPGAWKSCMLWQHTDGKIGYNPVPVDGIGSCDRSIFFGTAQQLTAAWAK